MKNTFTIKELLWEFNPTLDENKNDLILGSLIEKVLNKEVSFRAGKDNILRRILVSDVFIETADPHKFIIFRSSNGTNFTVNVREPIIIWGDKNDTVKIRWFKKGKLEK